MMVEKDDTAASRWFARRIGHALSDAEESAFRAWIAADPRHAAAYRQCESGWDSLGELAGTAEIARWREEARAQAEAFLPAQRGREIIGRRRLLGYAGSAIAATVVGAIVVTEFNQPAWASHATGPGQRQTITVSPRSRIVLAPRSRVEVRAEGEDMQARLLTGEAFFHVDAGTTPLQVDAPGCRIAGSDCGFQVRLINGTGEVIAISGAVSVNGTALSAGQRWMRGRIERVDAVAASSWRTGRLTFQNIPLGEVVQEINRYSADQYVFADPALGDLRLSGSFRFDSAEEFPQALADVLDLRVQPAGVRRWRISNGI